MSGTPRDAGDEGWKAAEQALAEARALRGPQRIEALKRAGQMRYDAHQRLRDRQPVLASGPPSGFTQRQSSEGDPAEKRPRPLERIAAVPCKPAQRLSRALRVRKARVHDMPQFWAQRTRISTWPTILIPPLFKATPVETGS
jgi:hypothetical protein